MMDVIGRREAIEQLHQSYNLLDAERRLEDMPSAQPEPCDDPRADVYYLAEKIGIHRLYALVVELRGEPEPCEDAVSRQAAIDAIESTRWYHIDKNGELAFGANSKTDVPLFKAEDIFKVIKAIPSAQPERKNGYRDGYKRGKRAGYKKGREAGREKGQWIRIPHDGIYCTTCKKGWSFMLGAPGDVENYQYCPHCGARMKEGEE